MLTDVIAALATPPGRSAVALLRLSGSGAFTVAGRLLQPFCADPPRRLRRARVIDPGSGETLDEVLYATFAGPASYTGQDVVEVSTHGGALVPAEVLAACRAAGARLAEPGEFTRRAVLNSRMDLLQAEAIGDLIDATAPEQRRMAVQQLDRGLSLRIERLRERILELETLVCYEIDFPEEDHGPVSDAQVHEAVNACLAVCDGLLTSFQRGALVRSGVLTVIAGRPNVGKSSLFNALLGNERAIVTDHPGTTRDAIEALASCRGYPFRLIDTAGLRTSDDPIERLGIEVSRRYLEQADLVVFCVESGRRLTPEEQEFLDEVRGRVVLVRTMVDVSEGTGRRVEEGLGVSSHTGEGLEQLQDALVAASFGRASSGADAGAVLTRERHRVALRRSRDEIRAFADARRAGLETAVAATHLRAAVGQLEELIGVVRADDVLGSVFATFCVGK